jgi:hypothetical protein
MENAWQTLFRTRQTLYGVETHDSFSNGEGTLPTVLDVRHDRVLNPVFFLCIREKKLT